MRSVILSPHLDDAVMSCWSQIRGGGALIINVFTGVPDSGVVGWWDKVCGVKDSNSHVRRRIAEDVDVLTSLDNTVAHLGHLDDQYRSEEIDPQWMAMAVEMMLHDDDLVMGPAGIGDHPDHLITAEALRMLDHPHKFDYADIPYALDQDLHSEDGWLVEDLRSDTSEKLRYLRMYETQFPFLDRHWHLASEGRLRYEYSRSMPTLTTAVRDVR